MSDVKDKIRKLLNLAENDGAFQGEIDNALRFARRLMLQHNITENELCPATDPHEIAADTEYAQAEGVTAGSNLSNWERWLLQAVTGLVGTVGHYSTHEYVQKRTSAGTVVFDGNGQPQEGRKIVFYGPAEDARDAAAMFEEWGHVIGAMARLKFGGCFRGAGRSYAEGFGLALDQKVKALKKAEVLEIGNDSAIGSALVVRSAFALMEAKKEHGKEWLAKTQGVKLQRTRASGNRQDAGAFSAGKADGANANFSRARTLKIGSRTPFRPFA